MKKIGDKMGSPKYKVSQEHDGRVIVYGNFHCHNYEEAVKKAYDKSGDILPFDFSRPFTVKRNSVIKEVMA